MTSGGGVRSGGTNVGDARGIGGRGRAEEGEERKAVIAVS
jgi:hypothetical protein